MSRPSNRWTACCCTNGFWSCACLLTVAVAGFYLALIPVVIVWQGSAGLRPAGAAALLNLLTGLVVLGLYHYPSLRVRPLVAMLVAMGVRMIPLLVVGLAVALRLDQSSPGGLMGYGFVGYLVVFYLATLAIETFISVQIAQAHHTNRFPVQERQA